MAKFKVGDRVKVEVTELTETLKGTYTGTVVGFNAGRIRQKAGH